MYHAVEPCASGEYGLGENCLSCQPGRAGPGCAECPVGQYQPLPGQATCLTCGTGNTTYQVAATYCAPCLKGTIGVVGGTCLACTGGNVPSDDRLTCITCGPGKTQVSGACIPCNAGYAGPDGLTCEPCPIGTFTPVGGRVTCSTYVMACPLVVCLCMLMNPLLCVVGTGAGTSILTAARVVLRRTRSDRTSVRRVHPDRLVKTVSARRAAII